jgi:predicted enzyme related to lactoylglutathione lyase
MAPRVSKASRAGAILAVRDFERSVAFYRDAIGFEVEQPA